MIIGIDPGHGGRNRGVSTNGIIEKQHTWRIAQHVGTFLTQKGYQVRWSRVGDEYVSLIERPQRLGVEECDLVLSFHIDSGPESWSGTNLLVLPDDPESEWWATKLNTFVGQHRKSRKWQADEKWPRAENVLRMLRLAGPTVLIEMGYATNKSDAAWLKKDETAEFWANSVFQMVRGLEI